jgi:hypothetical protein
MDARRKMQLESVIREANSLSQPGSNDPVAKLARQVETLANLVLEVEREREDSVRQF